jgi:hypothetical protein
MRLVCATEEWLRKYLALAEDRKLPFTIWPSRMALLVAEGKDLVAGVMVYDSTGPFIFFEHLVTNETATHRQRHRAVSMMADELMNMCRLLGKVPQVAVKHRGLQRILERVGLQMPGAFMMTCAFNQLERHDYETHDYQDPKFNARKPPGSLTSAAPTERAPAGDPEEHLGVYASVLGGVTGSA